MSENNLLCCICNDIYTDPVVLRCSHSFCKDCVQEWWSTKQVQMCPLCQRIDFSKHLPSNLALKNLCEDFLLRRKQETTEPLCTLHSEKLKLFCHDHQQLVCVICRDSREHKKHRFSPANEAAQHYKEKLLQSVKPLREKQLLFKQVKETFDKAAVHIKVQVQKTEKKIMQQFKNLHQFLQDEEKAKIAALKSEEKQKSKVIREKIVDLCRDITALSDTIRATEEETRAADVLFLQNHQQATESLQQHLQLEVPELISGALIDEAKHLANMTYNTWMKMKEMVSFSPVILDPNTAHPELILSEDLTSVTNGQKFKPPDIPERFDQSCCVLGSEGFHSGSHSWDVEVRNDASWGVGVVKESVHRKGKTRTGYWELSYIGGKYLAVSRPIPDKVLPVEKLQKVRVQLDWDKGKLSFFDLDTKKPIYTFKHAFTEKLFPYIVTKSKLPLKILPNSVSVTPDDVNLSAGFWPL